MMQIWQFNEKRFFILQIFILKTLKKKKKEKKNKKKKTKYSFLRQKMLLNAEYEVLKKYY